MDTSFTLTREVNAPRDQVFRDWTEADRLDWFLSELPQEKRPIVVDLRPGGAWTLNMVVGADDDDQYTTGGVYRDIDAPSTLSFVWGAADGWPSLDDDLLVTVTLGDLGERTEMTLSLAVPEGVTTHPAMQHGWGDTIDRLVARYAEA
jgi:uncharacterized protein YndB with AHSA1/START domain